MQASKQASYETDDRSKHANRQENNTLALELESGVYETINKVCITHCKQHSFLVICAFES